MSPQPPDDELIDWESTHADLLEARKHLIAASSAIHGPRLMQIMSQLDQILFYVEEIVAPPRTLSLLPPVAETTDTSLG